MPGKKATIPGLTDEQRRNKIATMYVQGHQQFTIATILKVSQSHISRELTKIREDWLAQRVTDYDQRMLRELTGLDMQESCLWEAWYNSCKLDIVTTTNRKRVKKQPTRDKGKARRGKSTKDDDEQDSDELETVEEQEKTTTRQMIGDPRFMAEITKVRELRCRLSGLLEDKPLDAPIINIWQQLQEIDFSRDKDDIEERLKMIESRPLTTDVPQTDGEQLRSGISMNDLNPTDDATDGAKE